MGKLELDKELARSSTKTNEETPFAKLVSSKSGDLDFSSR